MENLNFEPECDFDCDFAFEENFGLAKSFSAAPVHQIASFANFNNLDMNQVDEPVQQNEFNEIKAEGFCFKLAPVANQVEFQRSLKTMAPKMTDFAKGTTTLAFEFKEGVLIAVDARATQGPFISSQQVRKVIEINDFLLGTMAGGAADCQFWEKYVAMMCRCYELRNGTAPSVAMASMMLCSIMKQYKGQGLSMGTMFTGSDKTGASLYYIDNDATRLRGRLFAVGSGGTFAYGVLDTNYRYNMNLDEAVNLGIRAIASATYKDAASGGVVRVYHVTNHGTWELIHDAIDVSSLHYEFEASKGHRGDGRENLPKNYM